MALSLTAAKRSSVVHVIDPDSPSFTACGRRIGDDWRGEYSEAPDGPVTCKGRCAILAAEEQARIEASAKFAEGDRVGILTGFRSVGGAWIGSYGTVTAVRSFWNDSVSYLVRADGESDTYVYDAWMLREVPAIIPCQECGGSQRMDNGAPCVCTPIGQARQAARENANGRPGFTSVPFNRVDPTSYARNLEADARARAMAAHPAGKRRNVSIPDSEGAPVYAITSPLPAVRALLDGQRNRYAPSITYRHTH